LYLHARYTFRPYHVTFRYVDKLQTSLCTNAIHKSGYFKTTNKSFSVKSFSQIRVKFNTLAAPGVHMQEWIYYLVILIQHTRAHTVHCVHYRDHKIISFDFFVTIRILLTLSHHISWKTTSISNFHLFLGLPVGLCHWCFWTQIFPPYLSFAIVDNAPIISHWVPPKRISVFLMKFCLPHSQSWSHWVNTCRPPAVSLNTVVPVFYLSIFTAETDKDELVRMVFSLYINENSDECNV
jgi:hypothetical protein